ncbi:MAG: HAMP domain-containing histidine kinase, partial [Spirulinaceae cyanobacterium RM2_2_10]|nr:HAMP domain-containing histidine kinase [Spirulinaceae cyanobacterium RM2_2_10]
MDITERKAVEQMKDEFLSVASHELRTPLTSIRGSLGLLATGHLGKLSGKGSRMLDIAVNNADRLSRLIDDILDLERMKSGRVQIVKQDCQAVTLLTQAIETMQAMADPASVRLQLVAPTTPDLSLWVDPDQILQTLTNLISNSIKFSPPDSCIRLSATGGDRQVQLCVSDEGRGIPADKLESIFGRFQQVDAS